MFDSDPHIDKALSRCHYALLDVVGVINNPHFDSTLIRETGITLDRPLFPIMMLLERLGGISILDLSNRLNRDYVATRRHVAKLEYLGLVQSDPATVRSKVRKFQLTQDGQRLSASLNNTRQQIYSTLFSGWDQIRIEAFTQDLNDYYTAFLRFQAQKLNLPD